MLGLGEPRTVRAGVVGGSYFEVMGLRPVMGRLLDPADDGPKADGAAVLTYRFWTSAFKSDPNVIGKTIRLSDRAGDDRRRARAVGAVSAGNRDHRQRRHQPASSRRDDGRGTRAPDDRALRPAGAGRDARGRARGAARGARRRWCKHIPRPIRSRPTSASTRRSCATRSSRRRGRSCWCCWPRPGSSSSSPARTSRT